ncbi:MAG TPA: hypothetical protein VGH99_11675 [Pseudonocardia sp.]
MVVLGQVALSQTDLSALPGLSDTDAVDAPVTAEAVTTPTGPVAPARVDAPAGTVTAGIPVRAAAERTDAPALGAFEPVGAARAAGAQADVASLSKATGLAEAARRQAEEARRAAEVARQRAAQQAALLADKPSVRGSRCSPNSAGFGAVKPWVSDAGHWLRCIFGVGTVGGVAGRAGASDHPGGLALDFMIGRSAGDNLAEYALEYRRELKIKYVIWRQRINFGSGWEPMEDRGSPTANHFDHVHVSFNS